MDDREVTSMLAVAEQHFDSEDHPRALQCYTQLINDAAPHPLYYKRRTLIRRILGDLAGALSDINEAIRLSPDDGTSYWERGAVKAHMLSLLKGISMEKRQDLLKDIMADYKASVARIPTSAEAWLAVVETDLLIRDWDGAIGDYGGCKPYVNTKEYQLVRSWLGCLALTFAGDPPDDQDSKPLDDMSIRLNATTWCVSEIERLLAGLESEGFDSEKLRKAKEIHGRFLQHFNVPPLGSRGNKR
jgi:tetratricopeptide (TPR) repeat protein